jgi:hypothetical protein
VLKWSINPIFNPKPRLWSHIHVTVDLQLSSLVQFTTFHVLRPQVVEKSLLFSSHACNQWRIRVKPVTAAVVSLLNSRAIRYSGNVPNLQSGGALFESRPRNQLSGLRVFVIFSVPRLRCILFLRQPSPIHHLRRHNSWRCLSWDTEGFLAETTNVLPSRQWKPASCKWRNVDIVYICNFISATNISFEVN